ncbi:LOW QUALITY PROTEIN: hypothetical protein T265_13589 [Opisthorchis viverrini]|uniref:Uncharacterized protein n=1 Tax=Opisthorchis viverrini TaxID=6198 RepID=A0A074ZRB8_OPIVI|nr:LOW QUALITY PROTEIN: hypothetical protein T265_13589 [Opisthorchis viverrini]KER28367.1 LOW QUALITY PROTEIN: hypothetical protein T265_13589 [Opisthorchis viverrini]
MFGKAWLICHQPPLGGAHCNPSKLLSDLKNPATFIRTPHQVIHCCTSQLVGGIPSGMIVRATTLICWRFQRHKGILDGNPARRIRRKFCSGAGRSHSTQRLDSTRRLTHQIPRRPTTVPPGFGHHQRKALR